MTVNAISPEREERRRRQRELAEGLKAFGALDEVFAQIDAGMPWCTTRPTELLRPADRGHHPRPARLGLPVQIRGHLLDLAVTLAKRDRHDLVVAGERTHRGPELVTDLSDHRQRGDREPSRREEPHHLPADLQTRHVRVQIDPVQTRHVKIDMPVQDV